MGAGVGFSLVFALASAFVFLLPLMVGVLTWCEFSEKVDLDSIRQAADEKLRDMNNKMADLKEKGPGSSRRCGGCSHQPPHRRPRCQPCGRATLRSHACGAGRPHDGGGHR